MNRPWTALALAALMLTAAACREPAGSGARDAGAGLSPAAFIASGEGELRRLEPPWRFRFPADHGPHGAYRTEWWQLTGVLAGEAGRPLGLALSLLRIGVARERPDAASRWATEDVYMGRLSISAGDGDGLHTEQRISRGALGLAGARAAPMRVWLEDWRLEQTGAGRRSLELAVRAGSGDLDLELALRAAGPLVDSNAITGRRAEPGAAPFVFYVQPRLSARGTLRVGGRREALRGSLSMEHAWGELPLPGGPVARDRFTLYPQAGGALFVLRSHGGAGAPTTTGLLIDSDGRPSVLSGGDIELEPLGYWSSDRSGARYPVHWALRIPRRDIEWELLPHADNQEGIAWAPFWAGPVRLRTAAGTPAGRGLAQLNGYGEQ